MEHAVPFSFNLASDREALRNGVDISGGAMVSHNTGCNDIVNLAT